MTEEFTLPYGRRLQLRPEEWYSDTLVFRSSVMDSNEHYYGSNTKLHAREELLIRAVELFLDPMPKLLALAEVRVQVQISGGMYLDMAASKCMHHLSPGGSPLAPGPALAGGGELLNVIVTKPHHEALYFTLLLHIWRHRGGHDA